MPPTFSSRRCQSGTVRCISSTTCKEYRQHFEKDRALVRRFQEIDIQGADGWIPSRSCAA